MHMSEGQCHTRRVSKLYTSTQPVVRSTPLTDARQSASDRSVYCKSIIDSLGAGQSLAYKMFSDGRGCTRVRKQTWWTRQDWTWRLMSTSISSHRHIVVYVPIGKKKHTHVRECRANAAPLTLMKLASNPWLDRRKKDNHHTGNSC